MAAGLAASVAAPAASVDPALPRYEPQAFEVAAGARYLTADGRVAVVGYNDMADLLAALGARFTAAHPTVRFAFDLPGTRFAPDALADGRSAFAPMGAVFTPPQLHAYRAKAGHEPLAIRIAHASLDPRALSGPLAVFVHASNPIASLTLEQLGRVFARGVSRWSQLGLEGEWAAREIHAVGMKEGTVLAFEMRARLDAGGGFGAGMKGFAQSAEVVEAVAQDPQAIGFAAAMRATAAVRVLPIAARAGAEAHAPNEAGIRSGSYPLDRYLLVYAARPVSPLTREFLRLALSREGQEAIAASPQRYLPLSEREAAVERAKLDSPAAERGFRGGSAAIQPHLLPFVPPFQEIRRR